MSLLKNIVEGFLFAALVFLLFLVFFEHRIQLPSWLVVAGRMHPMFLHFPIVLLLIYVLVLCLPKRLSEDWIEGLGLVAALSAVLTAIMGFILSMEELREGDSFIFHKWGGLAVALIACALFYLRKFVASSKFVLRPLAVVTAVLIFLTGHWGANLTHGEDYLFEPFASTEEMVPFEQAFAFAHVVQPVLKSKCGSCHSAKNKKGGLSLLDTSSITEGGKTGPLLVAGSSDSSLLMQRILLPLDHKKHMAPKAKPQLTEEEIQLLSAWIKAGAPFHKKLIDLPATDSFRMVAAKFFSSTQNSGQMAYHFPPADEKVIQSLNTNYRVVSTLGKGSPALSVQLYGRDSYSPKAVEELLQVKDQITELSLAKLPVKDDDLKHVVQLRNLEKLNLNHTDISDNGISGLTGLKKLRELAVSGTAVTAASLKKLLALPDLRAIYIWNTKLDSQSIASLQRSNNSVRFVNGYIGDKDTTVYTLTPPTIKTPEGIFEGSHLLEVKHGVRGVEIRYTLDGSEPDSIKGALYKEPISVDASTTLKVKAFKKGWNSSSIAERLFIRKGVHIDSIKLLSAADSSFNPGTKVLQDNVIGNPTNHGNNKWVGYRKTSGVCLLSFQEPTRLQAIWLMLLKNVGLSIFPADQVEIWGGTDPKKLKLLSKYKIDMPKGYDPAVIYPAKISFSPAVVKYVKVVIHPLRKIPDWHYNKGKPSVALVSEIVVN